MKFEIENVGRISKAAIELKKLTIFIGKNDTGKTYASSTIWSLVELVNTIKNNELNISNTELSSFLGDMENDIEKNGTHSFLIEPKKLNKLNKQIIKKLIQS